MKESRPLSHASLSLVLILVFFLCSLDDTIGDYYYFNVNTGETQWAHPLDEIYKQKVIVARQQFDAGADHPEDGRNPQPTTPEAAPPQNKEDVTEASEDLEDNTSADILSNLAKSKVVVPDPSTTSSPMKLVSK